MINSQLQEQGFDTLLKLLKYYDRLAMKVLGQEFKYDSPEYKKFKVIIDDLDAIILEKYKEETNTQPNYSGQVSN